MGQTDLVRTVDCNASTTARSVNRSLGATQSSSELKASGDQKPKSHVISTLSDSGIYTSGLMHDQHIAILLDTGSTVSVMSEKLWKTMHLTNHLWPVVGTLSAANGSKIVILGETVVGLGLGNRNFEVPMIIARDVSHDCLLGSDFFKKYGCRILYDEGTFTGQGFEVPIRYQKQLPSMCRVLLGQEIEIEPGTEMAVTVNMEPGFECNDGTPGILETDNANSDEKICLARTLVLPRNGSVLVRLANLTDRIIRLSEKQVIGQFHPLHEDCAVVDSFSGDEEVRRKPANTKDNTPPVSMVTTACGATVRAVHRDKQSTSKMQEMYAALKLDNTTLSPEQKNRFFSLISEYQDIFARDNSDLGMTDLIEHEIDTGSTKPIKQAPRRVPPYKRDIIDEQLDDLLKHDRITPSHSPWSSPVVLARKHDGTYRMCIDYRKVNQRTVKDAQPLPRVDDTLETLQGAKWFSCLDLVSGYWQVKMSQKDREKTAFVTHRGQFEWTVMPFGLTNAPGTFQRLMNLALKGLTWKYCLVYIDDIIVWSTSFEDHLERLRAVFNRIKAASVKLKPTKCHFLRKSVAFLGHVVSEEGISANPEKTRAVREWPRPANITELRSFLGLASYYRRFVDKFAVIAAPLYRLCKKGVSFCWKEPEEKAFTDLKQCLITAPILAYPDFSEGSGEFILDTDASTKVGIGAVLSQKQRDGTERVIAYGSRSLHEPEKNYCVTRLEMLALVHFTDYYRYYLLGRKFTARTDHNALRWLMSFKDPQGQVARWLERMQEYDFNVVHRPGSEHGNADGLSRRPNPHHGDCPTCNTSEIRIEETAAIIKQPNVSLDPIQMWSREEIAKAQEEDRDIGPVLRALKEGKTKPTGRELHTRSTITRAVWAQFELLYVEDQVLRIRIICPTTSHSRTVLPACLVQPVLRMLHDGVGGNHLGKDKTLKKMKDRFWRPGLSSAVEEYCRACLTCAKCKSGRKPRAPLQPMGSGYPMQRVHTDVVGPLPRTRRGNRYILTVQCSFTKWVEAYPLSNQRAATCARAFVTNWVYRYGVPDCIHSDQGRNFESNLYKEMSQLLHMNKTRTTAYHPQGNGQVENFHRTLKSLLKTQVDEHHDRWDEHLGSCMMAYRSSVHASTGYSPFCVMFGREMRIPLDVMMAEETDAEPDCMYTDFVSDLRDNLVSAFRNVRNHLAAAQKRQKDSFDKGVKHTLYNEGDLVLKTDPQLKLDEASKFHRNWAGPYRILERISEVTYKICKEGDSPRRSKVVHFNNLKLHQRKSSDSQQVGNSTESPLPESTEDVTPSPDVMTAPSNRESQKRTQDAHSILPGEGHKSTDSEVAQQKEEQFKREELLKHRIGDNAETDPQANEARVPTTGQPDRNEDKIAKNVLTGPKNDEKDAYRVTQTDQQDRSEESVGDSALTDLQADEDGEALSSRDYEDDIAQSPVRSPRPVRIRKAPDRYGEWILGSLQLKDGIHKLIERVQKLGSKGKLQKLKLKAPGAKTNC